MSTSRLEKFIYAICSMEVSDLPAPLSRIEILWNCLITGETPDFEPQSRNEQYLMAMLGLYELENLPTPLSRGEKLLYKIAMGETDLSDIPAYFSRYEELLGYLAENGGVGDFEYILQTLNQRLSTLYSTKERPMKQAVIKGDTLVNELPRPSLKNTMTNAASQKLNQGYDNGKTLANLISNDKIVFQKAPTDIWTDTPSNTTTNRCSISIKNIKPSTRYIIKTLSETKQLYLRMFNTGSNAVVTRIGWININSIFTTSENTERIIISFRISENNEDYTDISQCSNILLLEYQDGMENWDIPYFEGTKTFSATPNVVDGEFKQAVVKGQTLVNLFKETSRDTAVDINYRFFKIMGNQLQPLKGNSQYTLIFDKYVEGISTVVYKTHANSLSTESYQEGQKILFTTVEDVGTEFHIFVKGTTIDVAQKMLDLQPRVVILEGDYTNIDIPYFEGMQSVQLSEVKTTGKNLFDINDIPSSYRGSKATLTNNGSIVVTSISEFGACYVTLSSYIAIKLKKDKVYSLSYSYSTNNSDANITLVDNTGSALPSTIINNTNDKFIRSYTPSKDINVSLRFYVSTSSDGKNGGVTTYTNIQIEESSVATSYEPYQSNTLTLAEPVNLRKVGDIQDEFDALTGQVTERVGEVVLNGSERWCLLDAGVEVDAEAYNTIGFNLSNFLSIKKTGDKYVKVNCDKLPSYKENLWLNDKVGCVTENNINGNLNDTQLQVRVLKSTLSTPDIAGFKSWLKTNPLTVQYLLETPVDKTVNTTITDQDGATQSKLHSFNDGYLSVISQGLLPSAVDYEVPTNNSYYLPDMLTLGAQYTSRGSADCHATIDGKLLALGKNRTFTTPSSVTDRLMVLDTAVDDLMFIKGDQTSKDFGYFEGMKSVEVSGIQVTGKNLFDGVSYIDGFIYGGGNTKVRPDNNVTSILVNLEKNTNYILSTKTSFDRSIIGGSTTPISINSYVNVIDCKKIDSRILFNSGEYTYFIIYLNNGKIELIDLQVEKGTVATPYEPYKSTTLTLNEPVTLRKVGHVQDTLDGLTGEVVQNIGEVVLDDSFIYQTSSSANGENTIYFQCDLGARPGSKPISSQFKTVSVNLYVSSNDFEAIRVTGSGYLQIRISKSKLNSFDVNGLNEYLRQNDIDIQYELAEPTTKTVDLTTVDQDGQPTKLKTFNDISYVEINADNLIPSVDVEVATKISETLTTLDPQQLDISNTQNKLGQTIDEQTENTDATMMATTEIYENL